MRRDFSKEANLLKRWDFAMRRVFFTEAVCYIDGNLYGRDFNLGGNFVKAGYF